MTCFVLRNCPNCGHDGSEEIVTMRLETLLKSNPGYDENWFSQSSIPPNYSFSFVQCLSCSFVFSKQMLVESLNFEYYNHGIDKEKSFAKIFDKTKQTNLIHLWSVLHDSETTSGSTGSIKVVDFGAGWGDFLAVAKGYGVDVHGLEYDQRKIERARANGIACGDYEFIASHAPYDIFMCNQVLEHLDRPKQALKQLRGVLKPGSVGFIAVPDYRKEKINEEISCLQAGKLPSKDFDPLGHLNYFDPVNFHDMVLSHGFAKIDENYTVKNLQSRTVQAKLKSAIKKVFSRSSSQASTLDGQLSTTSLFVRAV